MGVKSSVYFPYFRGKQYELVAVRESAELIAQSMFAPIIEPVREQTNGLEKALDALAEQDAPAVIIANPQIGDHSGEDADLRAFLAERLVAETKLMLGVLLTENMTPDTAIGFIKRAIKELGSGGGVALVHAGFSEAKAIADRVPSEVCTNIFFEDYCGKLYQRHFKKHGPRVLVRDGCVERRRNRDHPEHPEFFSDLHATFKDEGVDGFGDFLMVGDDYSEGGGPAYTIAIHLTYIDDENDDVMQIQHFKSDRKETPKDPAGKFQEALTKLISQLESTAKFYETTAVLEFQDLHARGHYPGLGYVKKLSMKHHIETLAHYFQKTGGIQ